MMRAILIVVVVTIGIPVSLYLFWVVHNALGRVCVRHARKFCQQKGLEICRARWQPAFDESGVKTDSTLVQLDCFDSHQRRKLIVLLVWPFGVRKMVGDEDYPTSYDEQWPKKGIGGFV